MLAFYRKRAGLCSRRRKAIPGWDADGRQLTGHIAGHHLSAVSLMCAATGDARFKQRADYIVTEMQDRARTRNGDGFAGALPGVKEAFAEVSKGNIRAANFDLNGLWSPWSRCTRHSPACATRIGTPAIRPRSTSTSKFAAWAEKYPGADGRCDASSACSPREFGGMNEMMADLLRRHRRQALARSLVQVRAQGGVSIR